MAAASVSSGSLLLPACVVLCCFVSCCGSSDGAAAAAAFHSQQKDAADIVGRALFCFNDRYIYSGCQGSFRLGPGGALDVPPGSADAFCGGPCLAETGLVLRCVDGVMGNFRFYNGASVADVRAALARGCGSSGQRGDFDVLQHVAAAGDAYLYGRGAAARRVSLATNLAPPPLLTAAAAIIVARRG